MAEADAGSAAVLWDELEACAVEGVDRRCCPFFGQALPIVMHG
jgi:hypothetical protein